MLTSVDKSFYGQRVGGNRLVHSHDSGHVKNIHIPNSVFGGHSCFSGFRWTKKLCILRSWLTAKATCQGNHSNMSADRCLILNRLTRAAIAKVDEKELLGGHLFYSFRWT